MSLPTRVHTHTPTHPSNHQLTQPTNQSTGTYAGGAVGLGCHTHTHATHTASNSPSLVRIQGFAPRVAVLPSKQRPRKLRMWGSDGRVYAFLLKGHEDLRQDERVMQLFGLVNALLASDGGGAGVGGDVGMGMRIARFAVMPLSANSGLIGWVRGCDTLHQVSESERACLKGGCVWVGGGGKREEGPLIITSAAGPLHS